MPTFTTGLGSQLMLAQETTYGTVVTPNRSFEYNPGETMALVRPKLRSNQLAAGRNFQSSSRTVATTRAGGGTVPNIEVPNQGFGTLLYQLHGEKEGTAKPAKEAATNVYKQEHKIGTTDPFEKSISLQIGKPTVEGVVSPFTYPGTVLTSMEFSQSVDGWLISNLTADAQDEVTSTALATFTPPSALEGFSFLKTEVVINSVAQGLARNVSLKIDTPKDTARYYLGAEKKARPLTNAPPTVTGSVTVDYKDNTLYKLFEEGKTIPIEVSFIGATVEAIVTKIAFKMSACKLEGDSPNVASVGELQQTIGFTCEDDRTNAPLIVTYVSKDSTL